MVKRSLAIGAALLAVTLSGCQVRFFSNSDKEQTNQTPQLTQAGLEQALADAVKEKQGYVLQSVGCEGPLKGEVGATQKCKIIDDEGVHYDVLVTTKSVNGDGNIKFNYAPTQTSNLPS
ncbi:Hypothetical protein ERS075552_00007 [Mycobacteroides abscessus]|uniref:DUF4333 domain-containing protein n=1 Tax=Mycobacteroides abscessus TaxID=36809 RepID=UPI0005DCF387|nr:DUF4333 domain-containing protein [Mycobacteroides abscessus]QSM02283.1 hypothetical protein PROPHIGD86-1_8 [Mycobacterium phage prophi86-1]MBN7460833.1 DUF4333 domain-containing protein [Mycobacteroides abscessus subsp. abscessus]CPS28842.1 Hypothetical protein ERS075494_05563 [Mycobacteroides abscessus]CPT90301.1 Hypothetical protein ERS075552_00007 [Mycobacteroides abscessus]CPV13577.1 Hypothetical protein ERS075562_05496 [Mycobacteroides abscessus]